MKEKSKLYFLQQWALFYQKFHEAHWFMFSGHYGSYIILIFQGLNNWLTQFYVFYM